MTETQNEMVTLAAVPVSATTSLAVLKAEEVEARSIRQEFAALSITSQEDIEFANDLLRDVKAKWDALEERRTRITGPLNKSLRETNALFQPALKLLSECERVLKSKVAEGIKELQRIQTESLRLIAQQSRSGDLDAARATMLRMPDARLPEKTNVREKLDFEVLSLGDVPEEFLCIVVNVEAVQAALDAGVRAISGLRIFPRSIVTVRK
jgi:hypothetical protein